jgi:predicted PurR-regulated permease PerM
MNTPSTLRSSDFFRTAAALFGIYLLAQLLWSAYALVLAAFLGVLFGLAVDAGVTPLQRFKIPRGVAAVAIVLAVLAGLFGAGAMVAPAIRMQVVEVKERIPESVDRLTQWLDKRGVRLQAHPTDSVGRAEATQSMREALGNMASKVTPYVFPFLSQTAAVIAGLFLTVFLAIYIGADPELYRRGLMLMFPQHARQRAGEVLSGMAHVLRKWLVTQLIAMVVIGVVTTTVLLILNVKAAFALGLLAGLLEFVATVGPLLSALPAIAMAFLDSPEKAFAVVVAYIAIQFLENNFLIPMLMKGAIDVPPALTITGQALLTILFGFLGLMVAVPLLAASLVAFRMLYVEPEPVLILAESMPSGPSPGEPPESPAG